MLRRRGFTLIELLVVIAIIGILAAMLFPVFARARESARKIQCLSNVKNVALAVQMYLTDYDRFPPNEHRSEVLAWFDTMPGGNDRFNGSWDGGNHCGISRQNVNPYLKWPVILEEYIKNRDVWNCPSAKYIQGASWIYPVSDWFAYAQATVSTWIPTWYGPCQGAYPSGWGGAITDSSKQGEGTENTTTADVGVFTQSIGDNSYLNDMSPSEFGDASATLVTCDGPAFPEVFSIGMVAYPELCSAECGIQGCGWADWVNCSSACSEITHYAPIDGSLYTNRTLLKTYSRHMGGVNLGFADGHAKWYQSDAVLAAYKDGKIEGVGTWGPHTNFDGCSFTTDNPGVPVLF